LSATVSRTAQRCMSPSPAKLTGMSRSCMPGGVRPLALTWASSRC
jgi:hypothetical protein